MDFKLANALGRIVELKDRSTGAHTWRVTMYAQAMAEAARMPISEVMSFMLGAVLHDLGKIDVPGDILSKPSSLTDNEYLTIQRHPIDGWERLRRIGVEDPLVLNVVRNHHERMDGSGYPDGLRGADIPMEARWFAVIDAFDAMTGLRPYRDGTREQDTSRAIEELRSHSGTWYEPRAVETFEALYEAGRLDSILDHLNDKSGLETATPPLTSEVIEMARDALLQSSPAATDHRHIDDIIELAQRTEIRS
ncbi:MAG: HD domain-containing phosphohydrolase [Phycisphaerales bacterium]|nr:HD domain-containing phosphohydrolase [Phycisphaerales bacterium]